MRSIAIVWMVLASPCVLAYTADELATRNLDALGGADKIRAIRTLRMSGKLLVNDGALELGYTALLRQPGSIRYEAALQGLTQIQAYDGHQAWQINPFQGRKDPQKLSEDDAKGLGEDAADFTGALVDYKSKGYKLDYLGTEDVDGTQAHKLRVTRPNGDIVYVYLDPDYFLEIRTIERRIEHGVPSETVTDYGDYEKIDGVYFALAQESGPKGSNSRQKVQFEKVETNVPANDSEFSFPAPSGGAGAAK